jgi:hypothetical protein
MKEGSLLSKHVHNIATSKEDSLDPIAFKAIKEHCRRDESAIGQIYEAILQYLSKPNAAIRLNCWRLIEQLFDRAHGFRVRAVEDLDLLACLAVGTDPVRPLPLPKEVAGRLQSQAIRTIRDWVDRFAPGYPKLKVSYAVLRRSVDFESLSLGNINYNLTSRHLITSSVPDPHGSAFNWSPGSGSGSRRVKKS